MRTDQADSAATKFDCVVLTSGKTEQLEEIPTHDIIWGIRGISVLLKRHVDQLEDWESLAVAQGLNCLTQLLVDRAADIPPEVTGAAQGAVRALHHARRAFSGGGQE